MCFFEASDKWILLDGRNQNNFLNYFVIVKKFDDDEIHIYFKLKNE